MFSTCSLELSKSKLFVPSQYKWSEVAQSCPTLCNPMDCRPPGSSIHGIFQGRILEWVAISFSRRSSRPRDWTQVSHIVADALPSEPPGNSSQYKDVCILIFYIFLTLQNMIVPSRSKLQVEKKIFFSFSSVTGNDTKQTQVWNLQRKNLSSTLFTTIDVNTMFCCPLWKIIFEWSLIVTLPKYVIIF